VNDPYGFGAPPAPPDVSALFKSIGAGKIEDAPPEISARDRLLVGGKILAGTPTVERPPELPDTPSLAREIANFQVADNTPDERLALMAARLDQYEASDPGKAAPDWRAFNEKGRAGRLDSNIQPLYERFAGGSDVEEEDWGKLTGHVRKTADVESEVGVTGKARIVDNDGRPLAVVDFPQNGDGYYDPALRAVFSGKSGESMPLKALTTESSGITVFADDYDVTIAAKPTPETDYWMRHMHPGPLGTDGVPRWMPSYPLSLHSFDTIDSSVLRTPGTVVETMHAGSYPGFTPGEFIAFDSDGAMPPWAQDAKRVPGGAARERPEFSLERLGPDDLTDGNAVRSAIASHAWAVFTNPGGLEGELRAEGYQPIPLVDGEPAILVIGMDADEAAMRGAMQVNDGVPAKLNDGPSRINELSDWSVPNAAGDDVGLGVTGEKVPAGIARVSEHVARYVYKVDQYDADKISGLADDLENLGASNVVIYSQQGEIKGFTPARERAYTGPAASVRVIRTADSTIGEPNSVPVHVRGVAGLPGAPVALNPDEATIEGIQFEVRGKKAVVEVDAEGDLFRRSQDAIELAHWVGHDNVELTFEGKRISLFKPDIA